MAAPVTPPKAAGPAPVAPAYPKWFRRPPAPAAGAPSAPSTAPSAPSTAGPAAGKAKAKARRNNRGPSQEWREGNRFRAFGDLRQQEAQNQAALAQQEVVQNQRNAFQETLQRQKAHYEAANKQLQEKMNKDLTEAKATYQQLADHTKNLEDLKTKHDLAETQHMERSQKQRAYYEKKVSDLDYMLQEYQTKRKQSALENQQLQEKLAKAQRCHASQVEQMELENKKLRDKLQKTEGCYFKLLQEAEAKKRDAKDESSSDSSPTSPANKNIKAAQAAKPKAGSVRLHCDSAIVMTAL